MCASWRRRWRECCHCNSWSLVCSMCSTKFPQTLPGQIYKYRHTTTLLLIMLGVEDYGSEDDSDNESPQNPPKPPPKALSSSTLSNSLGKPTKPKRAPKKITITLPELLNGSDDGADEERPPAKKPRLHEGAGSSSLLSMLPAPKQTQPIVTPPERVLGAGRGPGLVFNARPTVATGSNSSLEREDDVDHDSSSVDATSPPINVHATPSILFRPTSLGRSNISIEEGKTPPPKGMPPNVPPAPALDPFSLSWYYVRYLFLLLMAVHKAQLPCPNLRGPRIWHHRWWQTLLPSLLLRPSKSSPHQNPLLPTHIQDITSFRRVLGLLMTRPTTNLFTKNGKRNTMRTFAPWRREWQRVSKD